ncbi:TPA: hypothetical protein ACQUHP_005632 [Bacillus cereus]
MGIIPIHASATSIKGKQSYTQLFTSESSSNPSGPESKMMKWNLTVSLDFLVIYGKIKDSLQRNTFQNITREMTDQTFAFAKNRYNVMVFTADSKFLHYFQGIKFHAKLNYNGTNYDMYVFENGTFNTYNQEKTKPWALSYKRWGQSNHNESSIQFYFPKVGA